MKLTTKEMLIALAEGKKVRVYRWNSESYIHIVNGKIVDQKGFDFDSINHVVGDWELYEEPVKPVRRYKYDYAFKDCRVIRTDGYYLDDKDFENCYPDVFKFKRRDDDWTEL